MHLKVITHENTVFDEDVNEIYLKGYEDGKNDNNNLKIHYEVKPSFTTRKIKELQQENKQLQEELKCTIGIVEHNRIISEKNKEIHQLKVNMFEKEQLNSLVNSCQEEIRRLKKQLEDTNEELELVRCDLHNRASERNGYYRNIEILENQQKEFIEYMNKTIEELECDDVSDEEMKGYLIQRIDIFKEILKKYNEKVTDINVGSIGDKDE